MTRETVYYLVIGALAIVFAAIDGERRSARSGDDLPLQRLAGRKYFDVGPTDIDGQDFHTRSSLSVICIGR